MTEYACTNPDGTASATWMDARVPLGSWFVLGDNRNSAVDSRSFGFVPDSDIVALVAKDLTTGIALATPTPTLPT